MQPWQYNRPKRHTAALINAYTINLAHFRNPWIVAWWSAAFPGMGHMMLNKYFTSFILIVWELGVNYAAGVNLAIYYSMTGQIGKAIQAIDTQWFLLYICVYIFAIWDSYGKAVEINREYLLMRDQPFEVVFDNVTILERNHLKKRNPMMAVLWSFLAPGLGYLYLNKLVSAIVFIAWLVANVYFSDLLPAIHYTMGGEFAKAGDTLDIQWFLNIPSIYVFSVYDAYSNTVEINRLFEKEQAGYFRREYQNAACDMPI